MNNNMIKTNIYKRLAQAEAITNASKAELMETLQRAYENACALQDEKQAAELCRKIRNKLLDSTDKEVTFDRLGLDTSSITKFISSLNSIFNGAFMRYRQQLRDLPQQDGFPFSVQFPEDPRHSASERNLTN